MAHYRNFDIEMTIVPDAAGQYEAAFVIHEAPGGKRAAKAEARGGAGSHDEKDEKKHDEQPAAGRQGAAARDSQTQAGDAGGGRYAFPPVGSYPTPDDAREQTAGWARKWIDLNFPT